jgi:hypothetical protein
MEEERGFSIHNIIGRVTHGLIGLDLFLNEKKNNDYLRDFLTLHEDEMKAAFLSSSYENELIPSSEPKLSNEAREFIECVKKTQKLVERINEVKSQREIEDSINSLGHKMDIIYAAIPES